MSDTKPCGFNEKRIAKPHPPRAFMRKVTMAIAALCFCGSLSAQPVDSLSIKIGQMILIGFPGTTVDPLVLEEIRSGKVGSIVLFEKNIPKTKYAGVKINEQKRDTIYSSFVPLKKIIWTYQQASTIPLMVTIDQEGGRVNRLKEKYGFSRSITAQEMGRPISLDSVRFYSETTAAMLAGLGINVNFAPVVDLGVNKDNTVIYKVGRAFSANPDTVTIMANEFIRAHRKLGVLTVLKHFPGHGSSMADTHVGVADVTKTWTSAELIPYERLIAAGAVDAVMSAHIVNRNLDPEGFPGTLSRRIIDSLLRKQYNYQGVVFSDDMQMHAITKEYGLEEAIKRAIHAGIDILMFSNNIHGSEGRTVTKVHGIIRQLVESGQVEQSRINESYRRIIKMKAGIGLPAVDYLQAELNATKSEVSKLKETAAQTNVKKEGEPKETEKPKEKKKGRKK